MSERNNFIHCFRFICAILIVAIHTSPFVEFSEYLGFEIKQIISRIAVPFFFCVAGYFFTKKFSSNQSYINKYLGKIVYLYIFWSLVYFPYDFWLIYKQGYGIAYSVLFYLRSFIFSGSHYHLWYLSALIFAILILYVSHRKGFVNILYLCVPILYAIGLAGQSYFHLFDSNIYFNKIWSYYETIFLTTKNGLFFALPFVTLGSYIAQTNVSKINRKQSVFYVIISLICLHCEVFILEYFKIPEKYDMYISLLLLTHGMMLLVLKYPTVKLRFVPDDDYSLGIYLIHGIYVIIIPAIFKLIGLPRYNTLLFVLVVICSYYSVSFLKGVNQRKRSRGFANFI